MNSTIFTLAGLGGVALIYAAYSKSKTSAQKAAIAKGAVDPNYNPKAVVFAADQKTRQSGVSGWNTIVDVPCTPIQERMEACGYPKGFVGPLPDSCNLSGGTFPKPLQRVCTEAGCAEISPYFWSADKVPVNPNMPGSDADSNLAIDWFVL
jgi:hypothetical protein